MKRHIHDGTFGRALHHWSAPFWVVQNQCYFGHGRERSMPFKKHTPEEIIGKLRKAEIVLAQGGTTADACRRLAISEQTITVGAKSMAA